MAAGSSAVLGLVALMILTLQTSEALVFVFSNHAQGTSGDRKNVDRVALIVESMDGVAYTTERPGKSPGGLIEGIADYVRLTAGLAPSHWVKPGGGDKWDQGYDVTALFLQYCDSISSGFVADINAKMASGWDLGFFNDLTGKSVDQLWSDYKAKYAASS
ncbi:hypothetical protein SUGI_0472870 [Cryptomeria japonica]|nr:hypothetical protein SUGI_0472870 [Cryptomeria japonica]